MRALTFAVAVMSLGVGLAPVAPAAAQDYRALDFARDADLYAAASAARQREVALTNELSTLQARVQTDEALRDLAAQRAYAPISTVNPSTGAALPRIDTSKLASIPDAELAASNARVRAAAENRR